MREYVCVLQVCGERGEEKDQMGGIGDLERERVRGGRGGDREQLV